MNKKIIFLSGLMVMVSGFAFNTSFAQVGKNYNPSVRTHNPSGAHFRSVVKNKRMGRLFLRGKIINEATINSFFNVFTEFPLSSARTGRNPQTGATIQIAAKKVVKFKAGSALSNTVN